MELVAKNKTLLTYEFNGESREIKFSDLSRYWEYAKEDYFETGTVEESNYYIIGTITTASGQGGIVYVWDKPKNKLIHVSDGAFAVSAALSDGFVYLLSCVTSFAKKEEYMVIRTHFGVMDVTDEGEIIAKNIEGIEWNGNLDDIKLDAVGTKLEINCCGRKVVL